MGDVINSSSLFHFTSELDALKGILTNGLRFSYCFENVLDDPNKGVVIPMICFCDIPLMNTSKHRKEYGDYAIGFDKENRCLYLGISGIYINPVFYVDASQLKSIAKYFYEQMLLIEQTSKAEALSYIKQVKEEKINIDETKLYNYVRPSINFTHNTTSLLGFIKPYKMGNQCLYDEREWRALSLIPNDLEWHWNIMSEEFSSQKKEYNHRLHSSKNAYLSNEIIGVLISDIITHIIVEKDSEIVELIDYIMSSKKIFGGKIKLAQKKILISRITSFERISKDF